MPDFSKEVLIVATMGPCSSAGYRIDVDDVQIEGGPPRISVTEHSPGNGCVAAAMVTVPETVVAVSRFDGDPTFIEHAVFDDCE